MEAQVWDQISPDGIHLTILIFSGFLLSYALFSLLFRNKLHLSEPPLALVCGIIFGPYVLNAFTPAKWIDLDKFTSEFARTVTAIQCLVVGLELPRRYMKRNWASLLMFLGPVMFSGWAICAVIVGLLFKTSIPEALLISACLTPTDPVLAASVLQNSRFSNRVPRRLKTLLGAESGCNDGVSVPFLYIAILLLTQGSIGAAFKDWILITILWQCLFGTILGVVIGYAANVVLKFSDKRHLIARESIVVFYLLLALIALGASSTLGADDFLTAFACGAAFAHDGWFVKRTQESKLNNIIDLILNSSFFIFFGAVIPWQAYLPRDVTPTIQVWKLIVLLLLILFVRRIPSVLAVYRFTPAIHTWREALFCGHFGPMGVGALFLAAEAREKLKEASDDSTPGYGRFTRTCELIWPVVTFVVLGSTIVHGLSVAAMRIYIYFRGTLPHTRANGEAEPLTGMVHDWEGNDETSSDDEEDEGPWRGHVRLGDD